MDWGEALGEINYWAVILAAIIPMVVGFIWYSPAVFGEMWRKSAGLSKKQMESKEDMGVIFGGTTVFNLFVFAFLGAFLYATGVTELGEGALNGLVIGFAFAALPQAVNSMFNRKDMTYVAITGGYQIIIFAINGAVLAVLI